MHALCRAPGWTAAHGPTKKSITPESSAQVKIQCRESPRGENTRGGACQQGPGGSHRVLLGQPVLCENFTTTGTLRFFPRERHPAPDKKESVTGRETTMAADLPAVTRGERNQGAKPHDRTPPCPNTIPRAYPAHGKATGRRCSKNKAQKQQPATCIS